jgi:hypothetical protein
MRAEFGPEVKPRSDELVAHRPDAGFCQAEFGFESQPELTMFKTQSCC